MSDKVDYQKASINQTSKGEIEFTNRVETKPDLNCELRLNTENFEKLKSVLENIKNKTQGEKDTQLEEKIIENLKKELKHSKKLYYAEIENIANTFESSISKKLGGKEEDKIDTLVDDASDNKLKNIDGIVSDIQKSINIAKKAIKNMENISEEIIKANKKVKDARSFSIKKSAQKTVNYIKNEDIDLTKDESGNAINPIEGTIIDRNFVGRSKDKLITKVSDKDLDKKSEVCTLIAINIRNKEYTVKTKNGKTIKTTRLCFSEN